MKKKWLVLGGLAALATAFLVNTVMAASVPQDAVIAGKVVEVVAPGTEVREGDPILKVDTIGGPMVAARATISGRVEVVSVKQGSDVAVGQEILIINGK